MKKFKYVIMEDPFMSNWGKSEGKINILALQVEDNEEEEIVSENAKNRGDMKKIKTVKKISYLNKNKYYISLKTKEEYPMWYEKGAF